MDTRIVTDEQGLALYDTRLRASLHGTLWQSAAWARYQRALGRSVRIYERGGASALVIIDRTVGGFSTWDIPRGPLWSGQWSTVSDELLQRIIDDAKADGCMELTLSPVAALPTDRYPLTASLRHVHAEATRIIDLRPAEADILAQMHPKGRYNIGLAEKHGVTVREGGAEDVDVFYGLLETTGSRDGFKISQKSHYTRFLDALEGSFILIASSAEKPVAGLIGVIWNGTGIYYYGASSYEDRSLMAPYLLQREAMRLCKAAGCTTYDLLGISPDSAPYEDPWRGITDFKRKFGGTVMTYPAEQSLIFRPIVKRMLDLKRKIFG